MGWSLRRFPPIPRGRGRGRFAARRLARVINWAFRRARRLGVPFPSSFVGRPTPPSIVKRTDSHDQCAHWPRNDKNPLSLRGGPQGRRGNPHPRPQGSLVQRELARPKAVTEGLLNVDGPFEDDLCRDSTPSSHPRRRRSAVRRWPGWLMKLPTPSVGADAYIGPSLGTTCVAPVGLGDHTPP